MTAFLFLIVLTNPPRTCRHRREARRSGWGPGTKSGTAACESGCHATVYGLLLDEFYATEAAASPGRRRTSQRIVGARTNADNAAIQKVLGRYFTETDAGWVNDRGLEEMDSARKFSADQKARIEKRWNGKGSGNTETVPDSQTPKPKPKREVTTAHLPTRPDEKLDFESFKEVYPQRSGAQPWAKAVKAANARIKEGAHFSAMIDGARRYAAFCDTAGKTGTENMSCRRRRSSDRSNISWHSGPSRQANPRRLSRGTASTQLIFLGGTTND